MSSALSEMQQLMHELGPAMPEVDAIVQHEAGSWDIWFDGDVCMALDWQLVEPRLRLSIALGDPPEVGDGAVYEALLKANLAWSAQDSVRAAMCEAGQLLLLSARQVTTTAVQHLFEHRKKFKQLGRNGRAAWLCGQAHQQVLFDG